MKIIHLSDLHIKDNDNDDLIKIFSEINRIKDIQYVLITGDITDNGEKHEVDKALELFYKYMPDKTILPTLGNHDKGFLGNFHDSERAEYAIEKLFRPLCDFDEDRWYHSENYYEEEEQGIYCYSDPKNNIRFYMVDSADPENSEYFARGHISKSVASELEWEIDTDHIHSFKCIVGLHHHPFIRSKVVDLANLKDLKNNIYKWGMELENGQYFTRKVKKADLLLFGHRHVQEEWVNEEGKINIHAAGKTRDRYYILEV